MSDKTETPELLDAPNQQVVRPDGSGPWDEGEGGSTMDAEPNPLDQMTKAELIDEAERRGIEVDATWNKQEIREALG